MKRILACLVLLLLPLAPAAAETQKRSIERFDKLQASGLLEVRLVEGSGRTAEVAVEGTDPGEVVTTVGGKTLAVKMKKGILYDENTVKVLVTVSYEVLREIQVTTGAVVVSDGVLRGDKITVEAGSGGDADLQVDVTTLDLKAVSGSVLKISGKAQSQDTTVNTGGKLEAFGLDCRSVYIRVNTAGTAEVTAARELEAQVGTGGTLRYRGSPAKTSIKKGLGATVEQVR
ncbi:MAG: head GIN domain-containing protein [Spirochaetota bacterium]